MKIFIPLDKCGTKFTREEEDTSIDDAFFEQDQRDYVRKQIEDGNEYAFFCAKVVVYCGPLCGTAYLGACSYDSKKDFEEENYDQMVKDAYDDMMRQAEMLEPFIVSDLSYAFLRK